MGASRRASRIDVAPASGAAHRAPSRRWLGKAEPMDGQGGQPPQHQRSSLESSQARSHDITVSGTLALTGVALSVYLANTVLIAWLCPGDEAALLDYSTKVPRLFHTTTATAFFTAFVLNLTSFIFEDSVAKRQLALLSCTIKAAACYTDLLTASQPNVFYDRHGLLVVPQRYAQWVVTTPLMVFILSKISDFTPQRTLRAMAADVLMVVTGFCVHFVPSPFHWLLFSASCVAYLFVMAEMGQMVLSAIRAIQGEGSDHSRRSLVFIYVCTVLVWTLFPIAFMFSYLRPQYLRHNEALYMFANFTAKVLFSSSIMYGNYMTIEQRKVILKAEEENRARIAMVSELTEAVVRKDQFMSLMSHELRTPLNGVIQLSDALSRGAGGELNPKGQHFIATIKNSSNHLLNIINDILDVAALKEGKLTIKHELVDLSKAVTQVVDIVSPLAKKQVSIEQRVDPHTPLIIADFSRVVQVLYNLLGNALKFTKAGHVRVTVAPRDRTGTYVTIRVEDTGIGIPKDKINSIWGAFEQVDMSVTRKYGGTGLGLNIVKQLVASHEGTIGVDSTEGMGTTFTIHLPVLQRAARSSLEQQVLKAADDLGYNLAAGGPHPMRTSGVSTTRLSQGQSASGAPPRGLSSSEIHHPLTSPSPSGTIMGALRGTSGELSDPGADRILKQRTRELEQQAMITDLARRTDHKRSLEYESAVTAASGWKAHTSAPLSPPPASVTDTPRTTQGGNPPQQPAATTLPPLPTDTGATSNPTAFGVRGENKDTGISTGPEQSGVPWNGAVDRAMHRHRDTAMSAPGSPSLNGPYRSSLYARSSPGSPARMSIDSPMLRSNGKSLLSQGAGAGGSALRPPRSHKETAETDSESESEGSKSESEGSETDSESDAMTLSVAESVGARQHSKTGGRPITPSINSALARMLQSTGRKSISGLARFNGASMSAEHRALASENGMVGGEGLLDSNGHMVRFSGAGKGRSKGGRASLSLTRSATHLSQGLGLDRLAYSAMYGTVQILSVDDEEVNQIVLEEILTSAGYEYVRAMDGEEAIEWLSEQQTLPDLILLDCMMPNMSGHEFCQLLRQYVPSSVLPVIMVSAKSDNDNIVEGLKSGSNDFIRKPYQREELLARIETQLRLKNDSWWLAELVNSTQEGGRETESMKLLKNILPESIIERMQQGQKFVADSHQHVVILFSDIVGFTNLSSKIPTAEVFLMLSNMFNAFDKLTDRFSVYKVETIGDAYMIAAGHDESPKKARKGSPIERVIAMAKAMVDVVKHTKAPNGEQLRIRIGVHCGPAFAGVIGSKCPRYCFLGDTVNTASRMETLSFPMCIHLSASAQQAWQGHEDQTVCLGERSVKGKGHMVTYLVKHGDWEQGHIELQRQTLEATKSNASGIVKMLSSQPVGFSGPLDFLHSPSPPIGTDTVDTPPTAMVTNTLFNSQPSYVPEELRSPLCTMDDSLRDPTALHQYQTRVMELQSQLHTVLSELDREKAAGAQARLDADTQRAKAAASLEKLRGMLSLLSQHRTGSAHLSNLTSGLQDTDQQTFMPPSVTQLVTTSALLPPVVTNDGVGPTVSNLQRSLLIQAAKNSRVDGLPIITTRALLSELGYDSLAARFESEAVRLDQLLTMDLTHMQMLGLQPLGFCLRLRSAVTELAATLLRRCEERT